jgi:hypothetical protein
MKKNLFTLLTMSSITIFLSMYSCKKDNDKTGSTSSTSTTSTSSSTSASNSFTCKINGVHFSADSAIADFYNEGMTVYAFKNDTTVVSLVVDKPLLGNHPMDEFETNNVGYYLSPQSSILTECHYGSVNISAANETAKTATGTFSFQDDELASESNVKVTEGVFSIKK